MSVTYDHRPLKNPSPELVAFKEGITEYEKAGMNGPPPWSIGAPLPPMPENVEIIRFAANGLDCIKTTVGMKSRKAVYFIHGGGFMAGDVEDSLLLLPEITARSGIDGYSVQYTLVPEARYPTQIEQCVEMYKWLLAQGYDQIAVTGVSAGANLSLAVAMRCREMGLPMPACVACMSAALDSTGTVKPKRRDFLSADVDGLVTKNYAGDADLFTPEISALFADFNDFCPTLLQAGAWESLHEAHLVLIERLEKEGVNTPVLFSLWEELGHGFALEGGYYPEGYVGREQVIDYILAHFG